MEVIKVVQIMMYGAYNLTVMLSVPTLMTLVMLMVYYKEKGEFDSATVFTAMAVLYLIRMPLMMLVRFTKRSLNFYHAARFQNHA